MAHLYPGQDPHARSLSTGEVYFGTSSGDSEVVDEIVGAEKVLEIRLTGHRTRLYNVVSKHASYFHFVEAYL